MFDVGFSELLLLAIVALVVLGPEKLPHAARIAGAWVGRIRRTISTMQTEIEREVAAQEVRQALEKQFKDMGGQDFAKGLAEERQGIEATLAEAQGSLQAPLIPPIDLNLGIPPLALEPLTAEQAAAAASASTVAMPGAVDSAWPVLPQAATPPDEVRLDGDAAYREWLQSQRRENRIAPPAPDAGKDTPA
jgi:sec-independent protein translocase protein TatB